MRYTIPRSIAPLWALLISGCMAASPAVADRRPDVLFIAVDDMNDWTTLFDKDNPIRTPHLERMAKRGTFFSKAYCVVPACVPSRTAVLSGLSPTTSGCYTNSGSRRVWNRKSGAVSLPQYFRNNGYRAKGAGKIFGDQWAHGGDDPRGTELSWDDFQKCIYSNVIRHQAPDPRSLARMVQCYQASADYADSVVGRLLDQLDASGRADS